MTSEIKRNLGVAAARGEAGELDAVIIGGGIYGACLALEAARRGLRPVLIERGDFGGATSAASLRIVHGGLRYLQSMDLRRCRESARERAWMLREFPELVRPLACLMPLYGPGLRRPGAFRAALALDRVVGGGGSVKGGTSLPPGRIAGPAEVASLFPGVDRTGLLGGGVWHDGVMECPERLLIEILRWACACGALALNYTEAVGLLKDARGAASGVLARDARSGRELELRSRIVLNAAGPWCREVSRRLDRDVERLFLPSLAFNVLLDRPPPSSAAVAAAPRRSPGRMYFLVPCHGRTLAGTEHLRCEDDPWRERPNDAEIARFLRSLNECVQGWNLSESDVLTVMAGRLPAESPTSAAASRRPAIVHHADLDPPGPPGLWSVSGVKYTTARLVAERTLSLAFASRPGGLPPTRPGTSRPSPTPWPGLVAPDGLLNAPDAEGREIVRRLAEEESAMDSDDFVLRRTAWGLFPAQRDLSLRRVEELLAGTHASPNPSLHAGGGSGTQERPERHPQKPCGRCPPAETRVGAGVERNGSPRPHRAAAPPQDDPR